MLPSVFSIFRRSRGLVVEDFPIKVNEDKCPTGESHKNDARADQNPVETVDLIQKADLDDVEHEKKECHDRDNAV